MNTTVNNVSNQTVLNNGINYLDDHTIAYLPYLVLSCVGILIGFAGICNNVIEI